MANVLPFHDPVEPPDPLCDYHMFNSKPGGCVACLALGDSNNDQAMPRPDDNLAPVTGIAFQKVDTGIVRPVMEPFYFSPVDWNNQQDDNFEDVPNQRPADVPPKWEEFITFTIDVKNVLLNKMQQRGRPRPRTLQDGMSKNYLEGGVLNQFKFNSDTYLQVKEEMLEDGTWTQNRDLQIWARSLVKGLYGDSSFVMYVMRLLFPKAERQNQYFTAPPAESLENATIADGVPSCLVYGYDRDQVSRENDEDESESRGRSRKRVLLEKRLGHQERSRSRSPVKNAQEVKLEEQVAPAAASLLQVLDHPDRYQVHQGAHHLYFEPHRPDLCLIEVRNSVAIAKLIMEVSSHREYPANVTQEQCVDYTTERLVQACLSALACDQTVIYGLAMLVDGLKWIKVEKQDRRRGHCFKVTEYYFIYWDEKRRILSLFNMIDSVL